jgi:hypothetical protein
MLQPGRQYDHDGVDFPSGYRLQLEDTLSCQDAQAEVPLARPVATGQRAQLGVEFCTKSQPLPRFGRCGTLLDKDMLGPAGWGGGA